MFLCHQKRNFLNLENGVAMTHSVFLFYPYNFYLMLSYFIGDCKKYHYILKIVIWVVLHVNLTFTLSFVDNLHV